MHCDSLNFLISHSHYYTFLIFNYTVRKHNYFTCAFGNDNKAQYSQTSITPFESNLRDKDMIIIHILYANYISLNSHPCLIFLYHISIGF